MTNNAQMIANGGRVYYLDLAKGLCMTWVVFILHISQYLGDSYFLWNRPWGNNLTSASLGTFSIISGYLLGCKYKISTVDDALFFYKKRVLRFYPLFILSSVLLCAIGFNGIRVTILGLFGLAPFIEEQLQTLWYISMIMVFYFLTPFLLNSKRYLLSIGCLLFFVVYFCFFHLDIRFLFNLSLYLFGLCIATHGELFNKIVFNKKIQIISIILYVLILLSFQYIQNKSYVRITSYVGVIAILSLSAILEKQISQKQIIKFIGYVSMSCYLFHRFTYWVSLRIFEPSTVLTKTAALVLVGIPLCVAFSYLIQKTYDRLLTKKK